MIVVITLGLGLVLAGAIVNASRTMPPTVGSKLRDRRRERMRRGQRADLSLVLNEDVHSHKRLSRRKT